jgi:RNA polymerase sigma factor for flagellar operon FliA
VATNFPRHVDREELARAGTLGLVEASQRFDADQGVPFERYAARRIRGAILDSIRSADWAPRSVRTLSRRIDLTGQQLGCEMGRTPTQQEVAEAMGVTVTRLSAMQARVQRSSVLALDQMLTNSEDETTSFGEMLSTGSHDEPAEELESRELLSYLRDGVKLLPERHRMVIVGYFLENQTSADLARFLGVTESRVSQLRSEALEMLRTAIEAQFSDQPAEPDAAQPAPPRGRTARRKSAYIDAVGAESNWKDRLDLTGSDAAINLAMQQA